MSRTKRLRDAIDEYLESVEEANTNDILDHVNQRFRWGATMNQIGNIMAKDKRFTKLNKMERVGNMAGNYSVCVWKLSGVGMDDQNKM